jgi:hypothetical protein
MKKLEGVKSEVSESEDSEERQETSEKIPDIRAIIEKRPPHP